MLSFCTVITKDYLNQAMVLYKSIEKYHSGSSFYGLIIDGDSSNELYASLPFTTIFLDDLAIQNIDHMVVYYNAFELCNAVRPSLIKYLMLHYGCCKVLYLDADIYVTGSFQEVSLLLDNCLFSFTPHITKPLPLDGQQPDDLQILQVGIYNSGFWMFRKHERSLVMLDWLISRFEIYCFDDLGRRMFCDQKLLPMLVHLYREDFKCLDSPQYNVAHWNLFQRDIRRKDNQYWIDNRPVVFFHFSGFNPDRPNRLTHHLHRMTAELLETIQPILHEYSALLRKEDVAEEGSEEYRYSRDPQTGMILDEFRRRYYFEHRTLEGVRKLERRRLLRKKLKSWLLLRLK